MQDIFNFSFYMVFQYPSIKFKKVGMLLIFYYILYDDACVIFY